MGGKAINQVVGLHTLKLQGKAVQTSLQPPPVIIGLDSLLLKGKVTPMPGSKSLTVQPLKKRVFTDEQWLYLHTLTTDELRKRIQQGDVLIALMYRPEMGMNKAEADTVSSNLRFQQEAIQSIIASREEKNNG